MKSTALAFLAAAVVVVSAHAGTPPVRTSARLTLLALARAPAAAVVAPNAAETTPAPAVEIDPAKLAPFVVTAERDLTRGLDAALYRQRLRREARAFSVQEGGTFFERRGATFTFELKLKFTPGAGIEMLRVAW